MHPLVTTKDESFRVRVPSADLRRWRAEAKRARLTLSEFVRRTIDAALTPPPPA